MGHTGSKLKKFRQSLRRFSFSRSMENLKKHDSKKMRHSKSLTNLTTFRKQDNAKNDKESSKEKKLRRNTIVNIDTSNKDNNKNTIDSEASEENKTVVQASSEINLNEDSNSEIEELEQNKTTIINNHRKKEKIITPIIKSEEITSEDCKGVQALKNIDSRLVEMEKQIDSMTFEDLFVYHSTFKDEIHNFWIKAYEIKEANDKVKPKKNETIEQTKKLLHKLNHKLFQRNNTNNIKNIDSEC